MFAGDFRQTLPIDLHASRAQIINSLLHKSPLFRRVKVFELEENMRAVQLLDDAADEDERRRILYWSSWLRQLGDGDLVNAEGLVRLHSAQCRRMQTAADLQGMLDNVYDDIPGAENYEYWAERAIVAARHQTVDLINQLMLDRLPGDEVVARSLDQQDDDNHEIRVPEEFLNRQRPPNMPPHDLRLKRGAVVILLRNLRREDGLVNGTRMIIEQIRYYGRAPGLLICRILTGRGQGKRVIIPRILLRSSADRHPWVWSRRQFPVKLAYCMYVGV